MNYNFDASLKLVLAHEGDYVNNLKDPGGPTKKGVIQRVYDDYRTNKGLQRRTVKLIEDAEIGDIYRNQYWGASGDRLPAGLDYAIFDYSVNSGRSRAMKDLQRALNAVGQSVVVDGNFGEGTLAAINKCSTKRLIGLLCDQRQKFLQSLKTFGTFGKGWTRRVSDVRATALAMASQAPPLSIGGFTAAAAVPGDLPAPIGAVAGEVAGKASPADVSARKTPGGLGAIAGSVGISGTAVIQAANEVKPHINDSGIGKLALIGFMLLMCAGVALVVFQWYKQQREKTA